MIKTTCHGYVSGVYYCGHLITLCLIFISFTLALRHLPLYIYKTKRYRNSRCWLDKLLLPNIRTRTPYHLQINFMSKQFFSFLVIMIPPVIFTNHYTDVIMGAMASQITSLSIDYSAVYSGADQQKHQSSASLAFVRGINWGPVNSPHEWPVTRKMFPFDDVIMIFTKLFIPSESYRCQYILHSSAPKCLNEIINP